MLPGSTRNPSLHYAFEKPNLRVHATLQEDCGLICAEVSRGADLFNGTAVRNCVAAYPQAWPLNQQGPSA
jgi:hypothetical protein